MNSALAFLFDDANNSNFESVLSAILQQTLPQVIAAYLANPSNANATNDDAYDAAGNYLSQIFLGINTPSNDITEVENDLSEGNPTGAINLFAQSSAALNYQAFFLYEQFHYMVGVPPPTLTPTLLARLGTIANMIYNPTTMQSQPEVSIIAPLILEI